PSNNETEIKIKKTILIDYVITLFFINLGSIIYLEIEKKASQEKISFPSSYLIIELCRKARVPSISRVDTSITTFVVLDISRTQDEELVERRKRKRTGSIDTSLMIDLKQI
ncbi:hypothetical protein HAX54_053455, partial [Datura stramonium]|nr:hypothetical protein [Datura stramonium]